jgi:hypothetical protein
MNYISDYLRKAPCSREAAASSLAYKASVAAQRAVTAAYPNNAAYYAAEAALLRRMAERVAGK